MQTTQTRDPDSEQILTEDRDIWLTLAIAWEAASFQSEVRRIVYICLTVLAYWNKAGVASVLHIRTTEPQTLVGNVSRMCIGYFFVNRQTQRKKLPTTLNDRQ